MQAIKVNNNMKEKKLGSLSTIVSILFLNNSAISHAAVVQNDDVIVLGSECVGQDCNEKESFSFDTLRLKENNLRIHFDDTSASSSFPKNDWRLLINDIANGGKNYFAIEDASAGQVPFRIDAGADANALYINHKGFTGFGTAAPALPLHTKYGNTPALRLEQDGSGGYSPYIWDVAGNEINFFIRDASNGSKLPFRIKAKSPSNNLMIDNGKVGINNEKPKHPLHINSTDSNVSLLKVSGDGKNNTVPVAIIESTQNDATDIPMLRLVNNNGDSRIELENKSTGSTWQIANKNGDISFSAAGVTDKEVTINSEGELTVYGDITIVTASGAQVQVSELLNSHTQLFNNNSQVFMEYTEQLAAYAKTLENHAQLLDSHAELLANYNDLLARVEALEADAGTEVPEIEITQPVNSWTFFKFW